MNYSKQVQNITNTLRQAEAIKDVQEDRALQLATEAYENAKALFASANSGEFQPDSMEANVMESWMEIFAKF